MEYIGIEKEAVELVSNSIERLSRQVNKEFEENPSLSKEWMESSKLAECLGVSQRTLQNYKQRGLIGYSTIGRKIYYRVDEIQKMMTNK